MKEQYLEMQAKQYNWDANRWSLQNRDPVVGSYDQHNSFTDYDEFLFKNINTQNMIALEYGAGPGRNLIKFNNRFVRIDAVDISEVNKQKAEINLKEHGISFPNYLITSGDNIPRDSLEYDLIFSVICLQHICVYEIRYSIMKEIYRVLKPGGHFCAQMGYGGKTNSDAVAEYHENQYQARGTNGFHDVSIKDEQNLIDDLTQIGFNNYSSDLRPVGPGDNHKNWLWFQVQK
jgi:ubiquinone/menaquinone biosynthesis C-methylase UbiE